MKITIENTSAFTEIDGAKARIWEGKTENGVSIICAVAMIAAHKNEDHSILEKELIEREPKLPSQDSHRAFDLRFFID